MNKNNTAITVTTILCALFFIVIGSCFSAFLYAGEIVKVENVNIVKAESILVFDEKGEKQIEKLKLSKMKLGLKPATGEEDAESKIPATVHDHHGSEGVYAKFKLQAPQGAKIYVSNIKFSGNAGEDVVKEERENVMVSISEISKSTQSLKEDKVLLGTTKATEDMQKFTFLIWLSSAISDKFNSETISFDLVFEAAA